MNVQPAQPSHSKKMPPLSSDRRGVVLITVLWIMVGLSLLALTLAATVRTEATPGPGLGRGRAGLLLCPRGAGNRALPHSLSRPRPQQAAGPLPLCRGDEPLPGQQPEHAVPPVPHGRSRQAGPEYRPPGDPGAAAEDCGRQSSSGRDLGRRGGGLADSRPTARGFGPPGATLRLCGRTAAGSRDGTGAALWPAPPPTGRANGLSAGPYGLSDGLFRHQSSQRELRGGRSPGGAAGDGPGAGPVPWWPPAPAASWRPPTCPAGRRQRLSLF